MKGTGKYVDGKRPLSYECEWEFSGTHFVIRTENRILASWILDVIEQDLDQNTAYVLMNRETGERLEITSDHTQLPSHLTRRKKVTFDKKFFSTTIVFLLITLIGIWKLMPHLSRFLAGKVSLEQEEQLANLINPKALAEFKECIPKEVSRKAWEKFLSQVEENSDRIHISIVHNSVINALTFPGRRIVILSGLLHQVESPEEFAGIIGHEMGHVHHKHIIQKISNALFIGGLFHFLTGDFSGVAIDPSTLLGIGSLTFDRGMELEADLYSVERLNGKKIDPEKTKRFFERNFRSFDKLSFLSSHPGNTERIPLYKKKFKGPSNPLLTKDEWKALKDFCR